MSKVNPFTLISVRIWPEDAQFLDRNIVEGDRSHFIRGAIRDAVNKAKRDRDSAVQQADAARMRRPSMRSIVKERLMA